MKKKGIEENDTVRIGEMEFDYIQGKYDKENKEYLRFRNSVPVFQIGKNGIDKNVRRSEARQENWLKKKCIEKLNIQQKRHGKELLRYDAEIVSVIGKDLFLRNQRIIKLLEFG